VLLILGFVAPCAAIPIGLWASEHDGASGAEIGMAFAPLLYPIEDLLWSVPCLIVGAIMVISDPAMRRGEVGPHT
jgi:hypothetical protein